uniref:Putative ovule protein n=1 Tax=Solanum chacoense TaxID=4108 RepID=A0A0V0HWT4_SOLCH
MKPLFSKPVSFFSVATVNVPNNGQGTYQLVLDLVLVVPISNANEDEIDAENFLPNAFGRKIKEGGRKKFLDQEGRDMR